MGDRVSFVPGQKFDKTAFNELVTAEPTPIFQFYAANGLRENMFVIEDGVGASATEENSNFIVQSGAGADNYIALVSAQDAKYRSGQGLLCKITALFESAAADSIQGAGFINDAQGFLFGYNGLDFGVARFYGGAVEYQNLQVTTPAGGAENATVTVDGIAYTVPLTSGTVQHNAWEIANSLQAQVPNYLFTSNNDIVTSTDTLARVNGAFAFTSATAVATWTQLIAGLEPTQDWVAQENWSNPPSWTVDPTKGNVYQIRVQYLGYGGIRFYMENPNTSRLELVHVYSYANANVVPLVEDPTFRVGWFAQNTGNTTNLVIKGASGGAFNEGKIILDERSRSLDVYEITSTTTAFNLITIRNRIDFDDKVNRITVLPRSALITAEHNKPILFHFHLNGSFNGDLDFEYVDEENSCIEYSFTRTEFNLDGRDLGTVPMRTLAPFRVSLYEAIRYLLPGETLTIADQLSTGTGGLVDAVISWQEDQ